MTDAAPGLRERKKIKTRSLIIDTANRLFLRSGFETVTLDQIAGECDISVRTILRYFPTKESIPLARERDRLEQFRIDVTQRTGSAVEFWRAYVGESVATLGQRSTALRAHYKMIFDNQPLLAELLMIGHAFEDVLTAAIDEDRGGVDQLGARLLATVLVAGNAATVREWVAGGTTLDPQALLHVVDLAAEAFRDAGTAPDQRRR